MQMYGQDISAFEAILAELRAEFRKEGQSFDRAGNPSRHFFKPIEALFADRAPERTNSGQISRGSLAAIWDWINLVMLPTMARDYCEKMKPLIARNDMKEAAVVAAAFQSKVLKSLEGVLASEEGVQSAREGLGKYTSSHGSFDDLKKLVAAFRVRDSLVAFNEALPSKIDDFEGNSLASVRSQLDAFATKHPEAMPFALTMIAKRLKSPWQQIRLATKVARSRKANDIAATRYGISVSMALDHLEDKRTALKKALKSERIQIAKDTLVEIYDTEHALRVRIGQLEASDWGRRLNEVMAGVAGDLETELQMLPGKVHHVLGSAKLHRRHHDGLLADLTRKSRQALVDGIAHCQDLVGLGHKRDS